MASPPVIEFELIGTEFVKKVAKIRHVNAEDLLILIHKQQLMVGFQESEAIAWLKCGETSSSKFNPIAVKCDEFLNICKHQQQLKFTGETKLDAVAVGKAFAAKNIPLKQWQPAIEYLEFVPRELDKLYLKFLRLIRISLVFASSLDSEIKNMQIMYVDRQLLITALSPTGSLGYVGRFQCNSKWHEFLTSIKCVSWSIPMAAIKAFLGDEDAAIIVKNDKVIVYNTDYHIIFNQYGEARAATIFTDLLAKELEITIDLDYAVLNDILIKMPNAKTLKLDIVASERKLLLEATGFAKIQTKMGVKKVDGGDSSITLNFRQFKSLVGIMKLFAGTLSWGNFVRVNYTTDRFAHFWLLGKSYNSEE